MDEVRAKVMEHQEWLDAHPEFPFRRPPEPEALARRLFLSGAKELARWCGECGTTLATDDPVYWRQLTWAQRTAPVCRRCKCDHPDFDRCWCRNPWDKCWMYDAFHDQKCMGCGRLVYHGDRRPRRHVYCSTRCRDDALRAEHALTMAQRRFDCETCGEEYEPVRSDSRYCSPACRQKAYRQRTA